MKDGRKPEPKVTGGRLSFMWGAQPPVQDAAWWGSHLNCGRKLEPKATGGRGSNGGKAPLPARIGAGIRVLSRPRREPRIARR